MVPTPGILLVDDDESTIQMLKLILGKKGYAIETASTGKNGLKKAEGANFCAVLLDIKLPDMEGVELIAPLKKVSPEVMVVMLTAHASVDSAIRALNAGASAFLTKPLNVEQVFATVREAVEKYRLVEEKKHAEDRLRRVNRALRTISDVNQALIRVSDEQSLLQRICRNIVYNGHYRFSYISLAKDVPHHDTIVAWAGCDEVPQSVNEIDWNNIESVIGNVVQRGKPVVVHDVDSDEMGIPFRSHARSCGYISLLVLPLNAEGNLLGVLIIGTKECNAFDNDEVKLLGELADDLAFGIMSLRARSQRDRAEKVSIYRRNALESVYDIATSVGSSYETLCDQIVESLSKLLQVPCTLVRLVENKRLKALSRYIYSNISHDINNCETCGLCTSIHDKKEFTQMTGRFSKKYSSCFACLGYDFRSFAGFPITDEDGNILGTICIFDKVERTFNDEEVHLVEIFARYLHHEIERDEIEFELRQAQELKILGQLASGIAHEVRNSLNVIQAINEALFQDLDDNPEYLPYLDHIRKQVHRLTTMMKDLLELGKPKMLFGLTSISCRLLVDSALHNWRESSPYNERNIDLHIPADADLWQLNVDKPKLEQVFYHILENAFQHSPENEPVVVKIELRKDDMVQFRVTDKGSGIDPEYLPQVFEPFFTMRRRGTGLGLSMVKHVIDVHRGVINIFNNDPGPGLTVELTLPLSHEMMPK